MDTSRSPAPSRSLLPVAGIAACALASGAALVASIVFGVSLALTLVVLATAAAALARIQAGWLTPALRARVAARARTGLAAGTLGVAAYDLSRWLLVMLARLDFNPFETFVLFGRALLGPNTPRPTALAAGTAYHYLNGVAFAVSYCILLGGRRWTYGIVWAAMLEVAMFTLYPGWLDLRSVMLEFTAVSVTGHLAYGAVLGVVGERWARGGLALSRGAAP